MEKDYKTFMNNMKKAKQSIKQIFDKYNKILTNLINDVDDSINEL